MKLNIDINLEGLGLDKQSLAESLLTDECNKLISCITTQIDELKINASYTLRQSIEPVMLDDGFQILMNDYWKYVNEGVAGVREGTSRSGYSYAKKEPPINAIRKYVMFKGLPKDTVYKIRQKLFYKGITAKYFIDKAIEKYNAL